jgi:hypothetical protein
MPRDDPFKGIPLSEQTKKLDQRLFAPEPTIPPTPVQPPPEPAKVSPDSAKLLPEPKIIPQPKAEKPPLPKPVKAGAFDINDEALYKASFVFTEPELEALEDLKLELRRDLDQKVTKNDLIRAALHMLIEDHRTDAKKSYARLKVRRRSD